MANRRMFSKEIISNDNFVDLTTGARALYFELGMFADDDGFVSPKGIMRMFAHSEDDLSNLEGRGFIIKFETGVIVVTHWKQNNLLKGDRYKPTNFKIELSQLTKDQNGDYIRDKGNGPLFQVGTQVEPQYSIGKDSIGEDSKDNLEGKLPKSNYAVFIDLLNEITNRKFGIADKKAKRQFEYLNKQGYKSEEFRTVIENAYADDFHIKSNFKYLTPEFLTRPDKFERYLSLNEGVKKVETQEDRVRKFEEFEDKLKNS